MTTDPTGAAAGFAAFGPSHWAVLGTAVLGAGLLIVLGRRAPGGCSRLLARVLAAVIVVVNLVMQVWVLDPAQLAHTLPLQLSDLAPYVSAYALWTRRPWAFAVTYYWCLTLSSQALLTPVLTAPDFPGLEFVAFFGIHLLVVWAAIFLTWGLRMRPTWAGYRTTVAVTLGWAAVVFVLNTLTGSNYGFLNAKPDTGSVLDLLGPWPWYLLPEAALVLGVWALMTLPWCRRGDSGAPAEIFESRDTS